MRKRSADVADAWVAWTLGYVLHRAATGIRGQGSGINGPCRCDCRGAHKRENSYGVVMAAVTLTVVACVKAGSKVIGSSEQVHVVDALAMIGDEGRDSLR